MQGKTSRPIADAGCTLVAGGDIERGMDPLVVGRSAARTENKVAGQMTFAEAPIAWDNMTALVKQPWDRNCIR